MERTLLTACTALPPEGINLARGGPGDFEPRRLSLRRRSTWQRCRGTGVQANGGGGSNIQRLFAARLGNTDM